MIKKLFVVFFILMSLSIISVYVLVAHTNLFAQPTYTVSNNIKLIIDGEEIKYGVDPVKENGSLYIGIDVLKKNLNLDIIWDNKDKTIVYYDGEKVIRLYGNTSTIKINDGEVENSDLLLVKNGQPLINIKLIDKYANYQTTFVDLTNILVIDKDGTIMRTAQSIEKSRLRGKESIWSEVKDIVNENEKVYVYHEDDNWTLIRTSRGFFGYIENKNIKLNKKIVYKKKGKDNIRKPQNKINLTWEYVYNITPSVDKLEKVDGLDVISPTWFNIKNTSGDIRDKGSKEYIEWAHNNGYEIWGLFSNDFDPDLTNTILNSAKLREQVIKNILELALKYNLEGINLDFENVYLKDKDMLTQFVKELSPIARENNLILSMDITIKSLSPNWSLCYDREKLGKLVDYLILMAYDEHWANGGISGSVASLPWVEYGIETLLDEVPSEKVILGVPFYTRVWKEQQVDGEVKVTSAAVTMNRSFELIDKYNGDIVWDDITRQYYSEYNVGNTLNRIWLEDESSIKGRIDLIEKYDLSGVASWRRGYEKETIWEVINENLK
ncbi:MAG: hypothetical protein FH761_16740 [Firmicutes bacterium]|nr:hypothetical protein [Bacillota bacterium]